MLSYEEFSEIYEDMALNEVLSISQRRKKSINLNRNLARIKRGKEKASQKFATDDIIDKRARRKAVEIIKKKILKGRDYNSLSPVEKASIDKIIEKNAAAISRIAMRIKNQIRQQDRDKFRGKGSDKSSGGQAKTVSRDKLGKTFEESFSEIYLFIDDKILEESLYQEYNQKLESLSEEFRVSNEYCGIMYDICLLLAEENQAESPYKYAYFLTKLKIKQDIKHD